MQKLIPFDDALKQITGQAPAPLASKSELPLNECPGRILASDIISPLNVPPADNSAMDGYAIRIADLAAEGETSLPVSQRIPAGSVGTQLEQETTARIFTGAPVPPGADAVVMQEKVRLVDGVATIEAPVTPGNNIRRAGEDITVGDTILEAGRKLGAPDIGLAASIGLATLPVYKRIKVAVMCTGDELVEPGTPVSVGQIYNSNRYNLVALLRQLGCRVVDLGIVADSAQATENALKEASRSADLVISSGGVSVGEEDHVKTSLEKLGQLEMWKLALKPGKPLAFGIIDGTPFLGLPGNPVSVFVTFCLLARPFILKMQGIRDILPKTLFLPLDFSRPRAGFRREFIRVRLVQETGKSPRLHPLPHQGSGVLSSVSRSDGLAVIQENRVYHPGDLAEYIPYPSIMG